MLANVLDRVAARWPASRGESIPEFAGQRTELLLEQGPRLVLPGGQALVQAAFGGIDQGRDPLVGDEVAPLRRRDESRLALRDLAGDRRLGPGPRLVPRARHRLGGCAL